MNSFGKCLWPVIYISKSIFKQITSKGYRVVPSQNHPKPTKLSQGSIFAAAVRRTYCNKVDRHYYHLKKENKNLISIKRFVSLILLKITTGYR